MAEPRMLRIIAKHFTAAVIVGERAAPIIKYMATWTEARIRDYCDKKGWKVETIYQG